MVIPNKLVFDS